jgi:hypothetical protein
MKVVVDVKSGKGEKRRRKEGQLKNLAAGFHCANSRDSGQARSGDGALPSPLQLSATKELSSPITFSGAFQKLRDASVDRAI